MIDLSALKKLEGQHLELWFADGYVAHVKLIDVDTDSLGNEIIYDLERVMSWGPIDPKTIDMKSAHAANAADVTEWKVLD